MGNQSRRFDKPFYVLAGGAARVYASDVNSDGKAEVIEGTNGGAVAKRQQLSVSNEITTVWSGDLGRLAYGIAHGDINRSQGWPQPPSFGIHHYSPEHHARERMDCDHRQFQQKFKI